MTDRKKRMLEVFSEKGPIARISPSYRPRPGQIAMAERVHDAIERRGILLVEGPTGTGKSFAYLVPAVLEAMRGTRVVIATANINLQQQIVKKDLPFVVAVTAGVDSPVTFAELKGINNYWCGLAVTENADRISDFAAANPDIRRQADEMFAERSEEHTRFAESGDKSELQFEPDPRLWAMVSTDSEGCIGVKCPHHEDCGAMRARQSATSARMVVVNYHMLFADLMTSNNLIGKHSVLICDEAHEFSNVARDFFGMTLSMGVIARATKRCPPPIKKKVREVAQLFFDEVRELYFPNGREGMYTLRVPLEVSSEELHNQLELAHMYFRAGKREEHNAEAVARDKKDEEYVLQVIVRLAKFCGSLERGMVSFLECSDGKVTLQAKPVDISRFVYRHFFQPSHIVEEKVFRKAVILTSATLTDGETFQLVREELGVPPDATEYIAPSPFDLPRQSVVFLDPRLPNPSGNERTKHLEDSSERLAQVIHHARGRTLALFTSRRAMTYAYNYVTRRLREMGNVKDGIDELAILVQGTLSKQALIRKFTADTSSSLFGLSSFWTGVDVPGESLSVVAIDKLPFPTPDDPVVNALQDLRGGGAEGFSRVAVPRAAIEFRQGYGRLIRSVNDYGVMVFLDPRIATREYGKEFLKGLRGVPVLTDFGEFPAALRELDRQRRIDQGAVKLEQGASPLNDYNLRRFPIVE